MRCSGMSEACVSGSRALALEMREVFLGENRVFLEGEEFLAPPELSARRRGGLQATPSRARNARLVEVEEEVLVKLGPFLLRHEIVDDRHEDSASQPYSEERWGQHDARGRKAVLVAVECIVSTSTLLLNATETCSRSLRPAWSCDAAVEMERKISFFSHFYCRFGKCGVTNHVLHMLWRCGKSKRLDAGLLR